MLKTRIASIDYGQKRLGVAISDENKMIATSCGLIQAGKNSIETIQKILNLLKPYALERILIGYPLHLNGSVSVLAEEVQRFAHLLRSQVACEVELIDERLSTLQAERTLKEAGMRRKKRATLVDTLSAVILLQSYLGYS